MGAICHPDKLARKGDRQKFNAERAHRLVHLL